jgi:uncharacterized protein (DUF2267 family)
MSLHFEDYQTKANTWLNRVADRMEITDRNKAGRIFRAVLHALRDRLPSSEAAHLGAQLPIIWKGIYYDGYRPDHEPVRIRNEHQWLEFIRSKDALAEIKDLPSLDDARFAFDGVMLALHDLLSPGQYEKLQNALHKDIKPDIINH